MTTSNLATELANIHELQCGASIEKKVPNGVTNMNDSTHQSDLSKALKSNVAKTPAGQIKKKQGETDGPFFYDYFERNYKNSTSDDSPLTTQLTSNHKFDHCMWTNTNDKWREATDLCKTTLLNHSIPIDLQSPADFVMIYKDVSDPTNIIPIPVSCKSTLKATSRDITIKNNGIPTFIAFLYKACVSESSGKAEISAITTDIINRGKLDDAEYITDSSVEHSLTDMRRIGTHIIGTLRINPSEPYENLLTEMAVDKYKLVGGTSDKGWKKTVKNNWKEASNTASQNAGLINSKDSLNPHYHLKLTAFVDVKKEIIKMFGKFGWNLTHHRNGYYGGPVNRNIIENFFKFMLDVREMEYYKLFSNGAANPHIECINKETLNDYMKIGYNKGYLIPIGIGGTFLLYCGGIKSLSVRVKSAGGGIGDALKLDIKSIPSTICEEIINGNVSIKDVDDDEEGWGAAAGSTSVPPSSDAAGTRVLSPPSAVAGTSLLPHHPSSAAAGTSPPPPTAVAVDAAAAPPSSVIAWFTSVAAWASSRRATPSWPFWHAMDNGVAAATSVSVPPSAEFEQWEKDGAEVRVTMGVHGGVVGTIYTITPYKIGIVVKSRAGVNVRTLEEEVIYANKDRVVKFVRVSSDDMIGGKKMSGGVKGENDTRKDYVLDFYKEPLKDLLEELYEKHYPAEQYNIPEDGVEYNNYDEYIELLETLANNYFYSSDDNLPPCTYGFFQEREKENHPVFLIQYLIDFSNPTNLSKLQTDSTFFRTLRWYCRDVLPGSWSTISMDITSYKKDFIALREDLCNNYKVLWRVYFGGFNPWAEYLSLAAVSDGGGGGGRSKRQRIEGGKKTREKHKRIHKNSRRKPRKSVSPGRWLRNPKRYSRNKRFKLRKRNTQNRKT
jgi:hypothetical protein